MYVYININININIYIYIISFIYDILYIEYKQYI